MYNYNVQLDSRLFFTKKKKKGKWHAQVSDALFTM